MRMTKEFLEEMELIVDSLLDSGLDKVLLAKKRIDDACQDFQSELYDNHKNFTLAWGCSKLAIITHTGFCIKTGLGLYGNYINKDYCFIEWMNYLRARDRHIEYFFPETFYLGNIRGFNFYIQEEVECDEDAVASSWYEFVKNEDSTYSAFCEYQKYYCDFDEYVSSEVSEMDDDVKIRVLMEESGYLWHDIDELIYFIEDYDINDLHEGNWGYRLEDKKCVIVDFSGF